MYNDNDRNYVSIAAWMGMMLVTAIPVVGQIMVIVWAFAGDNESRKNYFRAILAFFVLFIGIIKDNDRGAMAPAIRSHPFRATDSSCLRIAAPFPNTAKSTISPMKSTKKARIARK